MTLTAAAWPRRVPPSQAELLKERGEAQERLASLEAKLTHAASMLAAAEVRLSERESMMRSEMEALRASHEKELAALRASPAERLELSL